MIIPSEISDLVAAFTGPTYINTWAKIGNRANQVLICQLWSFESLLQAENGIDLPAWKENIRRINRFLEYFFESLELLKSDDIKL